MATRRRPARKTATNLSLRSDLVKRARAANLNLSQVMEQALEHALRIREQDRWLAENAEAIDAYNDHVAKHGLFSDAWRRF